VDLDMRFSPRPQYGLFTPLVSVVPGGPDGSVYGEHTLGHDHVNEQPFTRTQSGVEIPNEVDQVTVEVRDSKHGYGGTTVTCSCPTGRSAGSWRSSGG
jgi:hypothetical protein